MKAFAWIGGLILLSGVAGGMSQLASGNLSGVTVVLGSLAFTALLTAFNTVGLRSLERHIPMLIQEINGVLDSAATFTGQAP